jgi:hypothetical protein
VIWSVIIWSLSMVKSRPDSAHLVEESTLFSVSSPD